MTHTPSDIRKTADFDRASGFVARRTVERMMAKQHDPANMQAFLESAGPARKLVEHRQGAIIFGQGDPSKTVFHVLKGGVKLSVTATDGREGVVAMLGPGDFFGEGCLLGQTVRPGKATATVASTIMSIDNNTMLTMLRTRPVLSDRFVAHMLARNIRLQEDLVDQIFNSCEKRLARTLLLLARQGQRAGATGTIPKISQETLAAMIGTTRARVNGFMNKFKRLGFIDCSHELKISDTLQTITAEDVPQFLEPADHLTRSTTRVSRSVEDAAAAHRQRRRRGAEPVGNLEL